MTDYIVCDKTGKTYRVAEPVRLYDTQGQKLNAAQLKKLAGGGIHLLEYEREFPDDFDAELFQRDAPVYKVKGKKVTEVHALTPLPTFEETLLDRADDGVDVRTEHDYAIAEATAAKEEAARDNKIDLEADDYPFLNASVGLVRDPDSGDAASTILEAANFVLAIADQHRDMLATGRARRLAKKAAIREAKTPTDKIAAALA